MRVLFVYADNPQEFNCTRWNCIIPMNAMNRTEQHEGYAIYMNDFVENAPYVQRLCDMSDIIFVERNLFGDNLTMMKYWKVRNKTLACVWDDAYDIMHPKNISYNFWTHGEVHKKNPDGTETPDYMKPLPITQIKWGLRLVKGATMPSVNLCKDWGKYTKTYYVHNHLEIEEYMNVAPLLPHPENEIWMGWCGSLSHLASFTDSGIITAMTNVCQKFPNVKILISGDKRIFDELPIPEESKRFSNFVPKQDWQKLVKSLDIGFAPLIGEYDIRRSWIKALEYMALQVPWIASDCITYEELRGMGTLVENTAEAWENAIIEMVQNIEKHREFAREEPYKFALNQSSDAQLENRIAIYQKIIDSDYPLSDKDVGYQEEIK